MMTASETDRIERSILINAPRERVWHALSSAEQFGVWFGADLAGQSFKPGQRARGLMTMAGMEHIYLDVVIDRIQPQDMLSFHWHPYAQDPAVDYTQEQPTLVTFTLKDAPGNGILLTVVESGFDNIPQHRRRQAFEMHGNGWEFQLKNVARYASE
jgi:uncharacterized protein YndB with AHSA1/START domain